jgi:hypothetical protein
MTCAGLQLSRPVWPISEIADPALIAVSLSGGFRTTAPVFMAPLETGASSETPHVRRHWDLLCLLAGSRRGRISALSPAEPNMFIGQLPMPLGSKARVVFSAKVLGHTLQARFTTE